MSCCLVFSCYKCYIRQTVCSLFIQYEWCWTASAIVILCLVSSLMFPTSWNVIFLVYTAQLGRIDILLVLSLLSVRIFQSLPTNSLVFVFQLLSMFQLFLYSYLSVLLRSFCFLFVLEFSLYNSFSTSFMHAKILYLSKISLDCQCQQSIKFMRFGSLFKGWAAEQTKPISLRSSLCCEQHKSRERWLCFQIALIQM